MKMKLSLFLLLGVLIFLFASCGGANGEETASEPEGATEPESATDTPTDDPTKTFLAEEAIQNAWGRYAQNTDYPLVGAGKGSFAASFPIYVRSIAVSGNGSHGPYLIQIKQRISETTKKTRFIAEVLYDYAGDGMVGEELEVMIWGSQKTTHPTLPACGDILVVSLQKALGEPDSPPTDAVMTVNGFLMLKTVLYRERYYAACETNPIAFDEISHSMTEAEVAEIIAACGLEEKSAVIPYDILEAYLIGILADS